MALRNCRDRSWVRLNNPTWIDRDAGPSAVLCISKDFEQGVLSRARARIRLKCGLGLGRDSISLLGPPYT